MLCGMRILSAEQMRAADRHAIDVLGIPSLDLLENAGTAVVAALEAASGGFLPERLLVLCGTGNNGGDGMVAARLLAARGCEVRLLLLGDPARLSPDAAWQWRRLERSGVLASACDDEDWNAAHLDGIALVVDALLGTGFRGELAGLFARVVEDVNDSPVPVLSIDVPSGLSGSSPNVMGTSIEASLTIALETPKICHVFPPASERCGQLIVAGIGIPEESLDAAGADFELISGERMADLLLPLARRDADAHKGDFGHVLAVGGSLSHSGAIALAGMAALRGGAGLVTVASPAPCVPIVAAHAPELMHAPLVPDERGAIGEVAIDAALLDRVSALVIGPGLGMGAGARHLLERLLHESVVPTVLDADALNVLVAGLPAARNERPLVLTPHPGELARLATALGWTGKLGDQVARVPVARELARRLGAVVIVKGAPTLVVTADGLVQVNTRGGPGLASGGTGDVLAGLLGALLAQGLPPLEASLLGVHLHGLAGDLAEAEHGQMSMLASDVLAQFHAAIESIIATEENDPDDDFGDDDE